MAPSGCRAPRTLASEPPQRLSDFPGIRATAQAPEELARLWDRDASLDEAAVQLQATFCHGSARSQDRSVPGHAPVPQQRFVQRAFATAPNPQAPSCFLPRDI